MNIKKTLTFIFLFSVLSFSTSKAQRQNSISLNAVRTENGLISGVPGTDKSVKVFEGIPYAAPPVGDLRWKEPQPVKDWQGIRKCDNFGPNAMQAKPVPFQVWTTEFLIPANSPISEDCLYLNVWTTAKSTSEKRPVIVYIHGGGFVNGSGSVPIYNGENMAKKGIVFVTINYRLGIFGFYSNPELTRESPHHTSGNYGILDQIAALKWVQKNIQSFGGDPQNVTIAGQSAGSMSVNILDASPLAKRLFAKIIAESAASPVKGMMSISLPLDSAEKHGIQFEKKVGATNLNDLRNMPAEKLLAASSPGAAVTVDGYVLPESIPAIFAEHKETDVPLLTGYNADDIIFPASRTFGPYKEYVRKEFGKDSNQVWKFYPPGEEGPNNLLRDLTFGVQNFSWALIQSEQGKNKSYLYFFKRKVPIFKGATNYGAFHTGEVSYAYDNLKFLNRPLVKADYKLENLMSSYWVNFAKNGNPNGKNLPDWAPFTEKTGETMVFDSVSVLQQHPYFKALEFLYKRAIKQ